MRVRSSLVLAAPFVGLVYACEDTDTGSSSGGFDGGASGFDASTSPSVDASQSPPPPPADAAPEAGPKGIVVDVRANGQPQADVTVLLHDASGAVTATQKTDATGRVRALSAPAMVTVFANVGGDESLLTYLGVADGDVLKVDAGVRGGELPSVGSYAVTFTAPQPQGISSYSVQVNGDCQDGNEGSPSPISIVLFPSCVRANNVLYGVAEGALGSPTHFTFKKGEPAPAANQSRPVQLPLWAAAQTTTLTATNAAAGDSVDLDLTAIADGLPFVVEPTRASAPGGVPFRWAQGFPDALSARAVAMSGDRSQIGVFVKRAAPSNAVAFDLATGLPRITKIEATGASPRPDVTITAAGSLAATDGGVVTMTWSKPGNGEVLLSYRWRFVVPPSTTTFKVPALPDTLASARPPSGVTMEGGFFEADIVPGYAEARALSIPLLAPPAVLEDYASLPLPANGTLRATLLVSGGEPAF